MQDTKNKGCSCNSEQYIQPLILPVPAHLVDQAGMPRRSRKFVSGDFRPAADYVPSLAAALDTSAQPSANTSQVFSSESLEKKMARRARAKFVTNIVAVPLSVMASPLENSYKTTLRCSSHLTEKEGAVSGMYCGQRWCLVCSRIRTARMIEGYLPQIEQMASKWFVTLTLPNVPACELRPTIDYMLKSARTINRYLRESKQYQLEFSGIRKLECTYNHTRNDYHPHFHFLVDSESAARGLVAEWLRRNPSCKLAAQDCKKANNNSVKELFKYFTKIASGKKYNKTTGLVEDYAIHLSALDIMYQAMRGKRVFQPLGLVREVKEEIDTNFAMPTERDMVACWSWMGNDWVDRVTGKMLSGYEPSAHTKEIAAHVVKPAAKVVEIVDWETGEVTTKEIEHFGELAPANPADILQQMYGPHPPRNYRAPVPCNVAIPRLRRILAPRKKQLSIIPHFIKCTPSTLSRRYKFRYSGAYATKRRAKSTSK